MTVCLGSRNHPPLTLVDLPGLIPNTAEASSAEVEKMVKDMLQVSFAPGSCSTVLNLLMRIYTS